MCVRRISLPVALLAIHGLLAPALAQHAAPPADLARWHTRLTRPGDVVSPADARAAQQAIDSWQLDVTQLAPDALYQFMRLRIHVALALGDANLAEELQPELLRLQPDTPETLWTTWLVASAAGDALVAQKAMEEMLQRKAASESAAGRRQSRLRQVGEPIMHGELQAGGQSISMRQREGKVLVLTFPAAGTPADDKQGSALRDLYAAFRDDASVQFVGAAPAGSSPAGADWPHVTAPAELQSEKFGTDVQVVIVDRYGFVRAAGAAADAEIAYALRAAASEARGPFRPMLPRTLAGVRQKAPAAPAAARDRAGGDATAAKPSDSEVKPAGELPRNPEAQRLLDQARVYLKTGRKTDARKLLEEILEKYPGTWEAEEAKLRLQAL